MNCLNHVMFQQTKVTDLRALASTQSTHDQVALHLTQLETQRKFTWS